MSLSPKQRHARARLAAHHRWHRDDPELLAQDRAEFESATIDRLIDRVAADVPLMNPEQRERLRQFAASLIA
jgi:hypothetical protein